MFCVRCGKELSDDMVFCTACGKKVEPRSSAGMPRSNSHPRQGRSRGSAGGNASKRPLPLIIGAVVVAVVLIAVIVFIAVMLPGCSRKAVAIDATNFPNDSMRRVVGMELDDDGDGELSPEEADAVTSIVVTPKGVEFVTGGASKSASIDLTEEWEGVPEDSESAESLYKNPDEEVGEALSAFPKVKSLVVRGLGLTEFDASKFADLEYLDCTGNSLSTLDLSKNKKLASMFCDDDVTLDGMDSAGLCYRDLITQVADSQGTDSKSMSFSFDQMGRVIEAGPKTFEYDDEGRLVLAQEGESGSVESEEYSYGSNGLLENAKMTLRQDVEDVPTEYSYEYGDKKRLTGFSADNGSFSGSISYSGDAVSSIKGTSSSGAALTMTMKTDAQGRITEVQEFEMEGSVPSETQVFGYLSNGMCSDWEFSSNVSGIVDEYAYSTAFTSNDAPQSTTVRCIDDSAPQTTFDVDYDTNDDGYITRIATPSNVAGAGELKISYVKHVGRLADIPSQRYVPVYRVANVQNLLTEMMGYLDQGAYASDGVPGISILEDGPMQVTVQAMGLAPNVVSNPNEYKLANYLADHWADA